MKRIARKPKPPCLQVIFAAFFISGSYLLEMCDCWIFFLHELSAHEITKSLQDHLADDFRIHLQQISEDFQRLESRIRALARENADLKSNGKSTLTPVAAGKVVFGGDHLQDSLENQFEEAFGSNYQDKLPTIDTTQISTVAKYQHSKTVSRSNSGDLLGKRIIVVG